MANGYQRGDYLTQFLQQLPQMYRAQQNLDLQRERFEYAKEEGRKDNEYRQEVLSANEERNKLVREQFEQRQIENEQDETYRDATFKQEQLENKQDETYRDATLKNAEKTQAYNAYNQIYGVVKETGDKDVLHLLAKQHPFAKDNPEIIDALNEGYDISESMGQTVRSIEGMSPIDALKRGRTLYTSQYLDDDSKTKLDATLKRKEDALKFTMEDLQNTPYGVEYAMYYERFQNIDSYLPHGTSPEDRTAFATKQLDSMDAVYKTAKQEEILSGGTWNEPRYDNVEDVDDDEIDKLIADFSTPFTERYPFSPDAVIDTPIQRAGFPMDTKDTTKKEAPLFIEDEAGLESLVEEYAPQGSLGIFEKAAKEGSVVKPVSNPVFKAIDGAMNTLSVADSTLRTLSNPATRFDAFSYQGKKAGESEKWNSRYEESSDRFKKTLKDMYNLYLRLDPKKGAYQGKLLGGGNEIMRKKIRKQLARYKDAGGKGKYSPYQYDKEIQSILEKIKF